MDWQFDLDNQAAIRGVTCLDVTFVQAHDALGDGQTQAGAVRVRLVLIRHSMEGNENISEHPFRNAGAVISYLQYRFRFAGGYSLQGHIYGGTWRRVSDCIPYDILDRTAQDLRHT